MICIQGLDLVPSLDLRAFEGLQRFEGYVLNDADSISAIGWVAGWLYIGES